MLFNKALLPPPEVVEEQTIISKEITKKTNTDIVKNFNEQILKTEAKLDIQNQCQEKFNICMDNFCKDEKMGRCMCSNTYNSLAKQEQDLKNLTLQIQNLSSKDLSYAKMSEEEKVFYNSISSEIKTKDIIQNKNLSLSTSKTGQSLYLDSVKSCDSILKTCPLDQNTLKQYYSQLVTKDCNTVKNKLEKDKNDLTFAKNKAEYSVKKALMESSKKTDNATCLTDLKDLVYSKDLCGTGFENCLNCNEDFNKNKMYKVQTLNMTKTYKGCTANNIEKLEFKKSIFNDVLNKCENKQVVWETLMIDFITRMEKAEKEQQYEVSEFEKDKEFDYALYCQDVLQSCVSQVCGTGSLSCTNNEKASQYNIALLSEEDVRLSCGINIERCNAKFKEIGRNINTEDVWASVWAKIQNEANQTYNSKLSELVNETGTMEKAQAKMEAELAESKKRSKNAIERIEKIIDAENATSDAILSSMLSKAEIEKAKAEVEMHKAKIALMSAEEQAKAERGCGKYGGVWKENNCWWVITVRGIKIEPKYTGSEIAKQIFTFGAAGKGGGAGGAAATGVAATGLGVGIAGGTTGAIIGAGGAVSMGAASLIGGISGAGAAAAAGVAAGGGAVGAAAAAAGVGAAAAIPVVGWAIAGAAAIAGSIAAIVMSSQKKETPIRGVIEFSAGSTFKCSPAYMGQASTEQGCQWTGGVIPDGGTHEFPSYEKLMKNSNINS